MSSADRQGGEAAEGLREKVARAVQPFIVGGPMTAQRAADAALAAVRSPGSAAQNHEEP